MEKLIMVARGKEKADIVFKNAKVFNVFIGDFIIGDVAICGNVVAGIGNYKGEVEIDCTDKYITPGFIDAHVHIESSMLSPGEFAKTIVPLGTTTVVADPHEIANVAGLKGIQYILEATEDLPLNVFVMLPSCVPATFLETSGAVLKAKDLKKLIKHKRVLGLGEMMNYPGVLNAAPEVLEKLELFQQKIIDGHAPSLWGNDLMAYAAGGISSDHECSNAEEAFERLNAGMYVMLREGSAAKNLLNILPVVNRYTAQFCLLATDDRHPADLLELGHINNMIKIAIEAGADLSTLLQMATINAARYFKLDKIGAIAPGYKADMLIFEDLQNWQPQSVYIDGKLVSENGRALFEKELPKAQLNKKIILPELTADNLKIKATGTMANVIELVPGEIITKKLLVELDNADGEFKIDLNQDLLKLVVVERHNNTGNIGVALVKGFGLKKGAIASTVAHDSHNLIIVGTNDEDIIVAAQEILRANGGITVVAEGEVLNTLALNIGGLMAQTDVIAVKDKLTALRENTEKLGLNQDHDPFLTLAFLSLPVIPSLKLTDKGLVDVDEFQIITVAK